jgi:hypothetical protein
MKAVLGMKGAFISPIEPQHPVTNTFNGASPARDEKQEPLVDDVQQTCASGSHEPR